MTVNDRVQELRNKVENFEFIQKDIDNGMHSILLKDIIELRHVVGNASNYGPVLKDGDKEFYLREFDRSVSILHELFKKSEPEERLKKLPGIKAYVNVGVELFLSACQTAKSDVLLKEESQIPDTSYPYIIK
jgi:hypothetical protein